MWRSYHIHRSSAGRGRKNEWGAIELEPEVLQAVEATAKLLQEMRHMVTDVDPPYEPVEYSQKGFYQGERVREST